MAQHDLDHTKLRLVKSATDWGAPPDRQLYLLQGDATQANLHLEIPPGMQFPPARQFHRQPFRLKIIHFNDLHGHLANISREGNTPIFAKMVAYIQQVRSVSQANPFEDVLVLSGGDDTISSPFDLLLSRDPQDYVVHPGYNLYSKAGIDATVLGNHEFDLGLDVLARAIRRDATFPVLSANLKPTRQLETLYHPAAIVCLKGIRVGLIGLTTPTAEMRSRQDSEFEIADPVAVVQRLLPIVRSLSDVVIILSHLGLKLNSPAAPVARAGDVELAQSLPAGSVDLIVGAHTHDALNQSGLEPSSVVNGIPITQARCNGNDLGQVDLLVGESVSVADVVLHPTAQLPVASAFDEQYVQPLIAQLCSRYEQKLGRVSQALEITAASCCEQSASAESALHNFITDGMLAGCRARGLDVDFGLLDASVISAGLVPGQELTRGDWLRVMPYADTIILFTLIGRELDELIQDNARRINLAGEPRQERGFLHFSHQVRYRIASDSVRTQIKATDIHINGCPLDQAMHQTYRIVTISFFRGLARYWEQQTAPQMPVLIFDPKLAHGVDTGLFFHDLLLEHIRHFGGITREGGALRDGRLKIS